MRLLMLTVDWPPIEGGIATLSRGVALALRRRGHAVHVLAPARPGAREPAAIEGGISVTRWRGYDLGPLRWPPFLLQALRASVGEPYDAVLAMNPAYGGAAALLHRGIGGPPYVAWSYGLELLRARGTPLAPLYRSVYRRARKAIAISTFTRDRLLALGVQPERIEIVPPGIDLPAPTTTRSAIRERLGLGAGPVILTVGRLVERKGHRCLLEAFARIRAEEPDARWVVVGRGPADAALRADIERLGLGDSVRLLGFVPDQELEQLYETATIFALTPLELPGDAEGYGIVYLEAGARGLPVVASRSGGVPDAVRHGETGLLVDPGASHQIADAIGRLLAHPELRRRLGAAGRSQAERSSWDERAARLAPCLEEPPGARS